MRIHHTRLAAAVALIGLSGAASEGSALSNTERARIREREDARQAAPPPEPLSDNLPGETNRQYAARMAALRAAATQEAGRG